VRIGIEQRTSSRARLFPKPIESNRFWEFRNFSHISYSCSKKVWTWNQL